MKGDQLYQIIGEWGTYQRWLFALIAIPLIMKGAQVMLVVVIFYAPEHRCQVPGLPNDTYFIQDEGHRLLVNQSVPRDELTELGFSQCSVFKNASQHVLHGAAGDTNSTSVTPDTEPCQAWVYDWTEFDSSLITQFDLVCSMKAYRSHFNVAYLAGNVFGTMLCGILCDWLGRKPVFLLGNIGSFVFGVAAAFPPSPEVFLVCRLFLGVFGSAIYFSAFTIAVELVGPTRRTMAGSLCTILWLTGPFSVAGLSFFVRHWQHVQLISALPLVLCFVLWWLLPESPRWLLVRKKMQPASAFIRKVARINKRPVPESLESMLENMTEEERKPEKVSHILRQLFKYPRLVIRTLIIVFNWFVISMTFYGLNLNVSNLDGNLRINFLLSCTGELVGYLAAWFLLEWLGRKRSHCCFMLTAGLACLATIFTVSFGGKELQWVTTALAMVGKMGISASFTSIYLISAELFPTIMRNFAMGSSNTFGRLGSVLSPYIADLGLFVGGRFEQALPLVVFGGLGTLAGLSAFFLPETLHRTLPDTMHDAVHFTENVENSGYQGDESLMVPVPSGSDNSGKRPDPNPVLEEQHR